MSLFPALINLILPLSMFTLTQRHKLWQNYSHKMTACAFGRHHWAGQGGMDHQQATQLSSSCDKYHIEKIFYVSNIYWVSNVALMLFLLNVWLCEKVF